MNIRTRILVVDWEEASLLDEMSKIAKEIHQLRSAFDVVNANEDPLTFDRIVLRLDTAEREYFLLFNQYRVICGHGSIESQSGGKFGGEHEYQSLAFDL